MDLDPLATEHPAGDPVATAEAFSVEQSAAGYPLDFSFASLETEIDRLLELPMFHHGRDGSATEAEQRNEAALAAYIGETLRRLFDGQWVGSFHPGSPELNFYLSFVMFGDYRFEPHLFVGYWLTNGGSEGCFREYLRTRLSRIKTRIPDDLQPSTIRGPFHALVIRLAVVRG
jgi:hypothetical protein